MGTHCEVEAQVPVGRGVQVGGAHSPPALLLEDQRRARLYLSALCPEHSAIYVPAEERKKAEDGLGQNKLCDIYEGSGSTRTVLK